MDHPDYATSKITKEPKQKSRLGTASNKIAGGLQLVCGRPTLALNSAMVPQTLRCLVCAAIRGCLGISSEVVKQDHCF